MVTYLYSMPTATTNSAAGESELREDVKKLAFLGGHSAKVGGGV